MKNNLKQRCEEVLIWQKTGLLPLNAALRELANTMPHSSEHQRLRAAENETLEEAARFVIDKS